MHIRQKGASLRITLDDSSKPTNVKYIAVDAPQCWSATFNAWGKRIDAPVIQVGARQFKIILEEIL